MKNKLTKVIICSLCLLSLLGYMAYELLVKNNSLPVAIFAMTLLLILLCVAVFMLFACVFNLFE